MLGAYSQNNTDVLAVKERKYIVLSLQSDFSEELLQCLTPHIMQWNERTWIMDLTNCLFYWQKQARNKNGEWQDLMRQIIERCFSKDEYTAVLGSHPWPCLLMAEDMRSKNLKGFVDLSHRFTQNLYQQVSWDTWLLLAAQIGEHFSAHKVARFREQSLRVNLAYLQKTVARLGFENVSELKGTDAYAIKRRFGPIVKNLWQWSEGDFSNRMRDHLYDFPWRAYRVRVCPQVNRHLDHAMSDWEQLSSYLREDLNRLCALPQWSAQDKVLCLEWKVVLHDLKALRIPIHFRHPHSLHQDSPVQKTALLQAYYRFQEVLKDFAEQQEDNDELNRPLIISWGLSVTETLRMPTQIMDIFGERSADEQTLAGLENRVSVPLISYEVTSDHQPEDSYCESGSRRQEGGPYENDHFLYLARLRPLFIYKNPKVLTRHKSSLWCFMERTMNKWWRDKVNESCLFRDYYQMTDDKNRLLWVFKDSVGRWFIHGIFA